MSFSEQGLTQQELLKTNKELTNKIIELEQQKNTLEQYLRIEKEVSDETIKELEQQNKYLTEQNKAFQEEYNTSGDIIRELRQQNKELREDRDNLMALISECIELDYFKDEAILILSDLIVKHSTK